MSDLLSKPIPGSLGDVIQLASTTDPLTRAAFEAAFPATTSAHILSAVRDAGVAHVSSKSAGEGLTVTVLHPGLLAKPRATIAVFAAIREQV